MRDDAKPVDSSIAFDPANPNNAPVLNWAAPAEAYAAAQRVAQRIASIVNAAKKDPHFLHFRHVEADLICIHCNGRPQDFSIWQSMDAVDACAEYSGIYYNLDRRTGKLPDFIKLKADKKP